MLDIHAIRENPDAVRTNLARRRAPEKLQILEDVIAADADWRRRLQEGQDLRRRRNAVSQEIAKLLKEGKDPSASKTEAAALPNRIRALETTADEHRANADEAIRR